LKIGHRGSTRTRTFLEDNNTGHDCHVSTIRAKNLAYTSTGAGRWAVREVGEGSPPNHPQHSVNSHPDCYYYDFFSHCHHHDNHQHHHHRHYDADGGKRSASATMAVITETISHMHNADDKCLASPHAVCTLHNTVYTPAGRHTTGCSGRVS